METLSFDVILDVSTLHLWFTCVRLPGSYLTHSLCAFSMTLTTPALDRRSSRWFEASPCRAASEGRPSISDAASFSSVRSSTSKPPLAFAAHPLGIFHIGLLARHGAHMLRVDQQQRAVVVLQDIEDGSPVDPCRLHGNMRNAQTVEPCDHLQQIGRHGLERTHVPPNRAIRNQCARHDRALVHVESTTSWMNEVHDGSSSLRSVATAKRGRTTQISPTCSSQKDGDTHKPLDALLDSFWFGLSAPIPGVLLPPPLPQATAQFHAHARPHGHAAFGDD